MTLSYSTDQQGFRLSVADILKRTAPVSALRAWTNSPDEDDRIRTGVAGALDLFLMAVPEDQGGGGFAFADVAAAIEQLGAGLLPGSTTSTLAAVLALVFGVGGDEAAAAAAEIASGGRAAAWVDATQARVDVTDDGDGDCRLTGRLPLVDGGLQAGHVACAATAPNGSGVFLVDATDRSVARSRLETLDFTREAAEIDLRAAPARRLRRLDGREAQRFRGVAALVTSLESVGAMRELLTMATAYARDRFQFGRQIGSYQAVKHRLVNMQVEFELARAAVSGAVEQVDGDRDGANSLVAAASAAKAACAEAGPLIAQEAIAIFGGIGYSWEHDAHLYFRRLNYLAAVHGSAADHLDTVIDELTGKGASHQ